MPPASARRRDERLVRMRGAFGALAGAGLVATVFVTGGCSAETAHGATSESSQRSVAPDEDLRPFVGTWVLDSPTGRGLSVRIRVDADGFGTYEVQSRARPERVKREVAIVPRGRDRFTVHQRLKDGRSFGSMMSFKQVNNFTLVWDDPDREIGDVEGRFLRR